MRRALLLATVIAGIAPATARAQLLVFDGPNFTNTLMTVIKDGLIVENTAASVVQLEQTVAAVAHGNVFAAAGLLPQLGVGLPGNPLGGETGQNLADAFMGTAAAAGTLAGAASTVYHAATFYQPSGSDYQALEMISQGQSAAAQMAFATRMLDSSQQRGGLLPSLFSALSGTHNVTDAANANTRVTQEVATAQNHTNQLLAAQVMQTGQTQMRTAQDEQAWRCSTDHFVAETQAAADAAGSGVVQLISGSPSHCATSGMQPVSFVTTQDPTAVNDGTTSVNLGSNSGMSGPAGGWQMLDQAWGAAAAQNAQALGVNPDALSATCVIESGCRNVSNGSSSASGPFQLIDSTYRADIAQAQAQNPGLNITGGKDNPATQAIAASQDLKNAAIQLQSAGVATPRWIDTRGFYNFGPRYGVTLATADPSQSMASILTSYSPSVLASNGVAGLTVGQWRQGLISRVGPAAAYAAVLNT